MRSRTSNRGIDVDKSLFCAQTAP